jgi:glycosyltransferase involved in cell wall biosynthesis
VNIGKTSTGPTPKILMVHNYYQEGGGEDAVFLAEQENLRRSGVEVQTFTVSNDSIRGQHPLGTAARTLWNARIARELADLVTRYGSDVVHFHNTFPLVSPASYWAVRRRGAAVVQTLHNFRLLCAGGSFYRVQDGAGRVCEDCLGKLLPLPAVQHACYRGSRAGSAVVATMQVAHRALGSYSKAVDQYIVLTEFGRAKMIEGGLEAKLLSVKPNFLAQDPELGSGDGGYALFVGRLTPGKGLKTLLEAWERLAGSAGLNLPLYIAGSGPMLAELQDRAVHLPNVHILGQQDADGVRSLMSRARLLIMPPEWYEGFPVTLLEAYAAGLPVVASDIGPLSSLVQDGVTGQKFRPGDPADLAHTVSELVAQPDNLTDMRQAARQTYLDHYTAEINAQQQLDVYARALAQRGRRLDSLPNSGEPPRQRATQP